MTALMQALGTRGAQYSPDASNHVSCISGEFCPSQPASATTHATMQHVDMRHLFMQQGSPFTQHRPISTCTSAALQDSASSSSAEADNPAPLESQSDIQPSQGNAEMATLDTDHVVQLEPGTQELLGVLSQPLPLGTRRNYALNDAVVEMNGSFFLDPAKMMDSTMRALYVIKQVLRRDGHICVVNSNPAFGPLMRHAARHCLNRNVWWHWEAYTEGTLLRNPAGMMNAGAQPARHALKERGLELTNVHCPEPEEMDRPPPRLDTLDKWRLWTTRATTNTGVRGRPLLHRVVRDENAGARLLLPGAGNQMAAPTLIVVLDLSHGEQVVVDAHEAGILTASVVNAHSELDRITYPLLAAEANPAYTHFFLNWVLKVANLPTPPLPVGTHGQEREDKPKAAGHRKAAR